MGALRPEFSVFVVDADFAAAESLISILRNAGFDTKYFPTFDSAAAAIQELPPHIVVFNLESFPEVAEDHLQKIRDISAEILTIVLAAAKQAFTALQFVERELAYDYQIRPSISSLELIQKLDRAAERLYFQFESEQLKEASGSPAAEMVESVAVAEAVPQTAPQTAPSTSSAPPAEIVKEGVDPRVLEELLLKMTAVKDLDQTVQAFLDAVSAQLHNCPVIYFKYIPHYFSLVLSQSAWLPIDKIRGIGVELKSLDPIKLPELFQRPGTIEPLKSLLKEAFRIETFSAWTHHNEAEILGVVVAFDNLSDDMQAAVVRSYQRIFELAHKRNQVVKEKHALEIHDPSTGLFNRKHFRLKLDDEISRSRRISMPLSMLILDVDAFHGLNKDIGFAQSDNILRMIAALLKKTTRANDIISRTGPDEMTLLLPHTDHMGAAVKAERIRRAIESTRFPILEGRTRDHLSVSIGVSEYPGFCNDAEGLIKTSDEALFQVKQAGGNRVCLATPPPGFVPDFVPTPVRDVGREKR